MTTSGDWREEILGKVRALIGEADPDAVETVKWRKRPTRPACRCGSMTA